ncbi:MAG TPA: HAD family hydrolase [Desulfobacterales bacterium]|nr:HAD family hydrolase [Desulfobacterales bacterium]
MALKGILFDLYGTLIDIETDESMEEIYRGISHFLTYHGIYLHRWEVRDLYYQIMKHQKEKSEENFPEIDVIKIWNTLLKQQGIRYAYPRKKLAETLAHIYRGISRKRLQLYLSVKKVLDELQGSYRLAIITDAQACYALPEIRAVGLEGYFDPVIISSNYGFRKPDPRMIQKGLNAMRISSGEVLVIGNDMYRDIYGAKLLGIKTIFFASNQGMQSYMEINPDFVALSFEDVRKGVKALR